MAREDVEAATVARHARRLLARLRAKLTHLRAKRRRREPVLRPVPRPQHDRRCVACDTPLDELNLACRNCRVRHRMRMARRRAA